MISIWRRRIFLCWNAIPIAQLLSGGDASAAAALTQAGILTGNDRGELGPEKRITRAEFVTMLYRADPMYDSSMKIVLKADHVVPGGDIRASAAFAWRVGAGGV